MSRGVVLPRGDVADARSVAVRCENLGYDACWTGELWGRDAFVALTAVADAVDRIDLGTAIVTGRVADGWLPHNVPFGELADAFETVAGTAREAGRDPDAITVAPYVPAAVAADPAEARATIRGHLAYYVGSGEGYRRAVASAFPDVAEQIATAWKDGDRDAARSAVTDGMVDALGVAGAPETARERFEDVASLDAVDHPIVVVPDGADETMVDRTIGALAP
jgi:5,10-methylenetetrahydromethanopterin reductase